MGYSIDLRCQVTGETLQLDSPHHMRGSTYAIGGSCEASLDITYNYAEHYYRYMCAENGIRTLYDKTGAESIPLLQRAISELADDATDNYWDGTEGNAKIALTQLLALAQMRPDGVWDGD